MEILGLKLTDYSAPALVALFVILIFLGVWVPRRDRDYWMKAAQRSADQVDKLIESLDPMVSFITEFKEQTRQETAQKARDKEGADPP